MKAGRGRHRAGRKQAASDAFLAGPENRLVEVAVRAVLAGPSPRYNPLVFYGSSGTGKSHLAQGLAAAWQARWPRRRVEVTGAAEFVRDLREAIEAQALDDLRLRFRRSDLVVFEGLEHLAEHRAAEEELVATLDALLPEGRQVVGTSNAVPCQLAGLLPALGSRLSAGLGVPLSAPGPAARLALLERFSDRHGVPLEASAVRLLAEAITGTVPELLGAVRQLQLRQSKDGQRIGAEAVRRFLARRGDGQAPSIAEIAAATARYFSVARSELRSPSRARTVVTARDVAMYIVRQLSGDSLQEIGRYFGGRDHTTVLHGCRKIEFLMDRDPAIREAVDTLSRKWHALM